MTIAPSGHWKGGYTQTDKVALITGGGTGIGRATGIRLARERAHIAVNYSRSAGEAETTCRHIEALGQQAMACGADVTNEGAVRAMVQSVVGGLAGWVSPA